MMNEIKEFDIDELEELEDFGVFGDDEPINEERIESEKAPSERTMTQKELFGNSYKQLETAAV